MPVIARGSRLPLLALGLGIVALAACLALAARIARATEMKPVDLALVLAADVSGSIADQHWRLQRDGIADAIGSDAFAQSLAAGQIGRVAISFHQWGTTSRVAVGWRVLESAADARAFAEEIRAIPRLEAGGTHMGQAVKAAREALAAWVDHAARRVVDVSGDGASNGGIDLAPERALALAEGITLNGLPIVTETEPKVADWYAENLIGGPGAFLVVAESYAAFAEAFRKKLTIEVAEAW